MEWKKFFAKEVREDQEKLGGIFLGTI